VIYEMRTYEAMPGKMPDIHREFSNLVTKVFEKHEFRPVGFWTESIGDNSKMHYLLAWETAEEMASKWKNFRNDPDWTEGRKRAEEEAGGPITAKIVNSIWQPTPYSPIQ
jgi:hypothetical protein